ncbi:MAG: putative 2-aminoethylphosphonate ABC transporter ATP-binding protein [Nitrospira sp.]|jgi:iron(III) transport system ATP-binding protein|nr:putative 2-aminoethylphosphonate ABC transporter ATP-binding protein [Nitrospira sp.]
MKGNAVATEEKARAGTEQRAPYLRIEHVTKMFGAFTALREVSLEVYEGEFICFLGPSGCGKTTLLRCIAGLDIQTSGRIIQAGEDISTLPPSARDFGIVFQSYALFPNLTVFKNLAYGLENRRMKKAAIQERVAELLDLVGLSEQGDKYPSQLSGGQQQRVALTRALATWPGLLLLDEPLSALDAKVRVHLRHEVRRLQRQLGIPTIMVTHDQEEALTMADRIVVMDQGEIVQVGTAIEIYREPATSFVADFVGTMNFMPAVVLGPQRVRLGGIELSCAERMHGLDKGMAVTVCIRPEDLTVCDAGHEAHNAASARVDDIEFLGAFYRVTLIVDGLSERPVTADFPPNIVRDRDIREGADLTLVFPDDRICVFSDR